MTTKTDPYLPSLHRPIPKRLQKRPIQDGMPVPWFVARIDGRYDFRVASAEKLMKAHTEGRCYTCGRKFTQGNKLAFPIGPMCVVNGVTSEPPSHQECAEWSAKACPFLNQAQTKRRDTDIPAGTTQGAGYGIKRQPGAIAIVLTYSYETFNVPGGILFKFGKPVEVGWWRKATAASREAVIESIESGMPTLMEMAKLDGPYAIKELNRRKAAAFEWLPAA